MKYMLFEVILPVVKSQQEAVQQDPLGFQKLSPHPGVPSEGALWSLCTQGLVINLEQTLAAHSSAQTPGAAGGRAEPCSPG